MKIPLLTVGEYIMAQAEPLMHENSSTVEIKGVRYDFANLIETSSSTSLGHLLELIVLLNQDYLLTREQTARFLSVLTHRVEKLVKLGKLLKTREGFFPAGAVYQYMLEKRNREMQALEEIIEFEYAGDSETRIDARLVAKIRADIENATKDGAESANKYSLFGLDSIHTGFLLEVLERDYWTEDEFAMLASQHGLVPAGAASAINKWALGRYNESLLNEHEGFHIVFRTVKSLKEELENEVLRKLD